MSYASIDDLRSQLGAGRAPAVDPDYAAKMLHALPEAKGVEDRAAFVLAHVTGKRVLEFGASGPLHDEIVKAASFAFGVDRVGNCRHVGGEPCVSGCVVGFDLDDTAQMGLPGLAPDIIVCGEVLEHLSNPGWFLTRLRTQFAGVPVLITVPNAFSTAGQHWLKKGFENVNADHVAWYSPKTLSTLLTRAGYTCADLYYYHGHGPTAEGLIVVAE